jgi:hypothetical protein
MATVRETAGVPDWLHEFQSTYLWFLSLCNAEISNMATFREQDDAPEELLSLYFDVPIKSLIDGHAMYVPVAGADHARLIFWTDNTMLQAFARCCHMLWWDADTVPELLAFYTRILDTLTSRLRDPLGAAMARLAVTPPGAPAARIGVSVQQLLEQLSLHT